MLPAALPPDERESGARIADARDTNSSGIQKETIRNSLLAWVLTLPVCVLLGAALFGASLRVVFRVPGVD